MAFTTWSNPFDLVQLDLGVHMDPIYALSARGEGKYSDKTIWRAVLQSKAGLEHHLQSLRPHVREKFRSQSREGSCAKEEGRWDPAISSFLCCKGLLEAEENMVHKQTYNWLLAWVNLPLAQMYHLRGRLMDVPNSEDMLEADKLWKDILTLCAVPLMSSHPVLFEVCRTYVYTDLYERSKTVNFEEETQSVQEFGDEPRLCLFLYFDCYYAGNLKASLRWIQEANRLWEKRDTDRTDLPDSLLAYCLACEVELMLQLGKSPESKAVNALKQIGDSESMRQRLDAKYFHLLQKCYEQMSKSAAVNGDTKRAETYEGSAKVCRARQLSLSSYNNGKGIPPSHPMMLPTPSPFGSALGVVQADYGLELHLEKLPAPIGSLVQRRIEVAQAARKRGGWEEAIREYEMDREFLKFPAGAVGRDTRDWLLTWVDLPLAYLYQYHARDCEKAVEIWKEMLECATSEMHSDAHLQNCYYRLLAQAEFERKCLHTSDGSHETIQQYAKLCGVKVNRAEHELCFWLYFGHYHHGANFEESLGWLLRAKALDEQHSPGRMCSGRDEFTFCCEYDYLRSEADLLIKLRKFKEAGMALKHVLGTRHVQEGGPRLAGEVRQWFYARLSASGAAGEEVADLRSDIEGSLVTVTNIYERDSRTSDQLPSPTGCFLALHLVRLTQSKAGLEQYLLELPVPIYLAFQKYTGMALRSQGQHDWEGAAYHHEMCRELLKLSGTAIRRETWKWLLVWASLPLAQIYQYRKRQIKRALDIWREMVCLVDENQPGTKDIRGMMFLCLTAGKYECTLSDYRDLKVKILEQVVNTLTLPAGLPDRVMDISSKNFGTNISGFKKIWVQEVFFLRFLAEQHNTYGNYEVALEFIQRSKRLLEENLSENEGDRKRATYNDVVSEATTLGILLGRSMDAIEVLDKYGEGLTAADNEELRLLKKRFSQDRNRINYVDWKRKEALIGGYSLPKEVTDLSQLAISDIEGGRLKEAAMYDQKCVEMIQSSSVFVERAMSTETSIAQMLAGGARLEQNSTSMFEFRQGISYKHLFAESMEQSVRQGSLKLPSTDDTNFSRAEECFKKFTDLSSLRDFASPADVYCQTLAPRHLVELYNNFDRLSYVYLKNSFGDMTLTQLEERESGSTQFAPRFLLLQYIAMSPVIGPMEDYAQMASVQHISLLSTREKYAESYIDSLDEDQSFTHLQDCYMRRGILLDEFQVNEKFSNYMCYYGYKSLLCAERERARVMLYQLGPNRPNYDTSRQLWQLDANDRLAITAIGNTLKTRFPTNGATVFVEYSREVETLFGKRYFIYLFQAGELYAEETIPDDPKRGIKTRLSALHNFFERRSSRRYNDSRMIEDLEYLFDVLMRPIAKFLEKMKPEDKLIVAPTELLTKVPFYALRDSEKPEGEKYLIQRHTITFTHSLRVLQSCHDRLEELQKSPPFTGRGSIVALGDPEYWGSHHRLKSTGDEVREIESLFGKKADVVTLLEKDATAEQLLDWAGKPSQGIKFLDVTKREKKTSLDSFRQAIIHIGAHGEVDEKDHTKNVIRLASSEKPRSPSDVPDCDLKAEDLTRAEGRIEWRAELVVLSACRTSVGKLAGEGVLSLARAFMIAGVPCVVASQWEVGDTAASVLMKDFYRRYRAGKDVASALRFSILERLKVARSEVREWAPFVVWGVPTLRIPSYLQQNEQ